MALDTAPQIDEAVQLGSVRLALQRRFGGRVSEETIAEEVADGLRAFSGARIRTFIPVLLQKQVTERLRRTNPA